MTGAGQAPRPAPHPWCICRARPGMNGRPDSVTRGPPDWALTRVELPGPLSTYLPSLARSTSCVWCPRVGVPVTAVTAVGPDLASGRSAAARSIRLCRTPRVRS